MAGGGGGGILLPLWGTQRGQKQEATTHESNQATSFSFELHTFSVSVFLCRNPKSNANDSIIKKLSRSTSQTPWPAADMRLVDLANVQAKTWINHTTKYHGKEHTMLTPNTLHRPCGIYDSNPIRAKKKTKTSNPRSPKNLKQLLPCVQLHSIGHEPIARCKSKQDVPLSSTTHGASRVDNAIQGKRHKQGERHKQMQREGINSSQSVVNGIERLGNENKSLLSSKTRRRKSSSFHVDEQAQRVLF